MAEDRFRGASGIVTGASRGLGRLLAIALAERGMNLVLAARNEEDLAETAEEVAARGARGVVVGCDVTRKDDLSRLVEEAVEALGPPDLLVNNAGIETVADFREMSLDEIESVMVTNSVAPMWLTRLVVPHMVARKSGHIVNISSIAGKSALPYFAAYASSKHALVGFSWCMRQELKRFGIGVSVICPGFINGTGMADEWALGAKRPALAPKVEPAKVVKAVLSAIDRDRGEVVVGSGLSPLSDVFFALSPELTSSVLRVGGMHDYLAAEARARPAR